MSSVKSKFILRQSACCDPFKCHSKRKTTSLREVTKRAILSYPSLKFILGQRLCTKCRKQLAKLSPEPLERQAESSEETDIQVSSEVPETSLEQDRDFHDPNFELNRLNECLSLIGESPIERNKRIKGLSYMKDKAARIDLTVRNKIEIATGTPVVDYKDAGNEMIDQLKAKFQSLTNKSEKVQVLTVLPKSWSVRKVAEEFQCSNYMARKANNLVKKLGIMSIPNAKCGKVISKATEKTVEECYLSESISRQMPGMKDFVSVNVDGQKQHLQKHLVLCNLKEAYQYFKDKYPNLKIGFSKFAELRPKQCVLAGSSGTHCVCVCTTHQNIKLMFSGANLDTVTNGDIKHYRHCLAAIQCNPPNIACFFGQCSECPGTGNLRDKLETDMEHGMIDEIQYKQWTSTDRSTLETKVQTVDEFLTSFMAGLTKLLCHDFIASQQSIFFQQTKNSLGAGEFLVVADFAENYSFVIQDAAQSFHWNNLQATIHPFVCYYRTQNIIQQVSFVIISECNTHDTIAVHLFQRFLITFLTNKFGLPNKLMYFSDGCAAQYKNLKNFINLCYHEIDFGIPADWHFFATSHGKGPCDGVGGTIKILAARASLQRPYNQQIMTPLQLFEFAQSDIKNIHCQFVTTEMYKKEAEFLSERFKTARTIPGTRKIHSICPLSKDKAAVRVFSSSSEQREEHVSILSETVDISAIKGYVTVIYDSQWWLACVTEFDEKSREVHLTLYHPHGPAPSYRFPDYPDTLTIDRQDILTTVHPTIAKGHTYKISVKEKQIATRALTKRKSRL